MKPASSPKEFLQHPEGRYWTGRSWMAFCAPDGVAGFMLWGQPDAGDVRKLLEVIALRDSPLAVPRPRWFDLRRLVAADPAAFLTIADFASANASRLKGLVTRGAILHGGGLVGALAAGFSQVVVAPYPLRLFTDSNEALAWIGLPSTTDFVRELDEAQAASLGTTPLLRDLRAWLSTNLRAASLSDAARALRMSARSLQRRLQEQGTSFQGEVSLARVAAAQRMLRQTDAHVSVVAHEVGCASVHRFGELFRKTTGTAPSRWRAANFYTNTPIVGPDPANRSPGVDELEHGS
jgi:AraC-like DNA-binding protein